MTRAALRDLFALTALAAWALVGGALAAPCGQPTGPAGDRLARARAWCLGEPRADHAGGRAFAAVGLPLLLAGALVAVRSGELRRTAGERPEALVACGIASLALASAGVIALAAAAPPLPPGAFAFRAGARAPRFDLTAHDGRRTTMDALEGRVVLVTAAYSRCGTACPMLLAEARALVESVPEGRRGDLVVAAITLDPEHDDVDRLATLARARGMDRAPYTWLTGKPEEVERTLDAYGFERRRDAETGVVDHVPAFVLVDRGGRLAERTGSGPEEQARLGRALERALGGGAR